MALFDTVVDGVGFSAEQNNIVNGKQFLFFCFFIQVFIFPKKLCVRRNGGHNQGKCSKWLGKFKGKNHNSC